MRKEIFWTTCFNFGLYNLSILFMSCCCVDSVEHFFRWIHLDSGYFAKVATWYAEIKRKSNWLTLMGFTASTSLEVRESFLFSERDNSSARFILFFRPLLEWLVQSSFQMSSTQTFVESDFVWAAIRNFAENMNENLWTLPWRSSAENLRPVKLIVVWSKIQPVGIVASIFFL